MLDDYASCWCSFWQKSVPWCSKCCRHIPLHWAPARSRSFWNSDCFNHYGIYGSRVSVLLSFGRWPVVLILALDLRLNHRDNSSERPFNRLPSPYLAIIIISKTRYQPFGEVLEKNVCLSVAHRIKFEKWPCHWMSKTLFLFFYPFCFA